MPSLQLILYTVLGLAASGWGVLRVVESPKEVSSYAFVLLFTALAFFEAKSLWDSWQDILESKRKALKGDPEGMFELAQALRQTNTMGAISWAEKAAGAGHREASFLAGFLRYGFGLRDQETFDYFMSAAKRGEEAAMRAVADCYKLGHCVLPNDRLSFEWRFKSASNWSADFQSRYFGALVIVEPVKAPGYVCSRYAVGMSYLRGEGCEKNEVEGYAWLLLAARARHTGAIKKVRELDRRKAFKLRAQMQDRSLEIAKAFERGTELVPIAAAGTTVASEAKPASIGQAVDDSVSPEDAPEPVSAWRAFFTVFLSGNLLMAVLFVGARLSPGSSVTPELQAILFAGFLAAALVAAFYGRKLSATLHFLLLAATSVVASAAFAYCGQPILVGYAIGASLACGAIVLPLSIILMHWRHVVADYLFYGLIALHGISLIIALI
jgi:TPR repeat protein